MTAEHSDRRPAAARHVWLPGQHGAWAMLLLPLLLGIAASRPSPWHVALGGAAFSAYLASATIQAWSRTRRRPEYRAPILVYGGAFVVLGIALLVAFPALAAIGLVAGPAALIVLGGARPGTRRDLANSLAQVAQALVLVPAAAYVAGDVDWPRVMAATGVAAGYLVGTVLVVRSVLRERGNERFAALSAAFHVAATLAAVAWLPPAYALLGLALAARAVALPVVQRRRAATPRPLRPIHVGLVEIAASVAVVAVAFATPV